MEFVVCPNNLIVLAIFIILLTLSVGLQVLFTNDSHYGVKDILDKALQGHETSNFDCHVFTKNHRRLEVLLNITPRTDESGRIVGMLGVGQDITERRQVEMEKTQVAQELQTLIDTANAPIFGIDAQGLVNVWNTKTAEITGFSRDEALGKDLLQVFRSQLISTLRSMVCL